MSALEMGRVLKLNMRAIKSGKLVLVAIADNADDDGYAFPGMKTIAEKSDLTERHAKRVIQALANAGQIHILAGRGRGNTNAYVITAHLSKQQIVHRLIKATEIETFEAVLLADQIVAKHDKMTPIKKGDKNRKGDKMSLLKKVTSAPEKVTKLAIKGDIAMSPEPSVTIIQPSDLKAAAATAAPPPIAFDLYERNIGALTPVVADEIKDWIKSYPEGWITDAIRQAALNQAKSANYITRILERWQREGRGDLKLKTPSTPSSGAPPSPQPVKERYAVPENAMTPEEINAVGKRITARLLGGAK